MWRIVFEYDDHSKITLRGNQKDISARLAKKYYQLYGSSTSCIKCEYRQYPLKNHEPMDLTEKIEELEEMEQ